MGKFIRVSLTEEMEKDYKECARLLDEEGKEKDCENCSLNGGNAGCLGEYSWEKDEL